MGWQEALLGEQAAQSLRDEGFWTQSPSYNISEISKETGWKDPLDQVPSLEGIRTTSLEVANLLKVAVGAYVIVSVVGAYK